MSKSRSLSSGQPERAEVDAKVSCPIVCGDYYRATGFFFKTDAGTFLVTARHNVLPTELSQRLPDGQSQTIFTSERTLPEITIYLRNDADWDVFQTDIREAEDVRQTPDIDVIGVLVDFDPTEYGYCVWTEDDIISEPPTEDEIDVVGYDGISFPSPEQEHDVDIYRRQLGLPRKLSLMNPLDSTDPMPTIVLAGVDPGAEGEYTGLSGSPILGESLVGIHAGDSGVGPIDGMKSGDANRVIYSRAEVLLELLTE
ncbi:hypothetical protein [Halorubrum sp. AJ67]|uniref:hypothetical protein n=1 Tax=Halorubrum sp. AJ67 TaxID=1173487 RepID=UPI00064ED312|nr:hypothetical protein [Halorubrum sp. AJ67]